MVLLLLFKVVLYLFCSVCFTRRFFFFFFLCVCGVFFVYRLLCVVCVSLRVECILLTFDVLLCASCSFVFRDLVDCVMVVVYSVLVW